MPMIHVARDGAKLGEFTLEQIREGLGTGQFRSSDLGWQPGMADWRPLSELVGVAAPGLAGAAPSLPLAATGVSAASAGAGLPWEHRAQLGFVKAWFDTVTVLITKPSEAFTMMRREGGLLDPLLFGLIGGCAGSIVSLLFQGLFQSIPGLGSRNDLFDFFGLGAWGLIIIYAVLMPVLVTVGLFLGSGILHLCLMLVGGANRSFETTFRVACFTAGAANLFSMIPICGGIIALVYHIVLECIGLSRAHETTTGKALMAIFLPMIVCCGVVILLGVLLGGFGALWSRQH
ncbi:MAG TPA: YIP1 family protein [Chthoniobacterales bacterium]|nr:YIP1 family protein [Chthoniobacterales bacterium]